MTFLYNWFVGVLNNLPDASIPASLYTAIQTLGGWANSAGFIIPFDQIVLCITMVVVVILFMVAFKVIKFILSLIPFF